MSKIAKHIQSDLPEAKSKKRSNRPFVCLHRDRLSKILSNPSMYLWLQSKCGKTTQRQFLKDIFNVLDVLTSEMCLITRKIGTPTRNGFALRTWEFVAIQSKLPLWRVKQVASWLMQRGLVESTQPREVYIDENGNKQYRGLPSIKRLTKHYFQLIGLTPQLAESAIISRKKLIKYSKVTGVKVKLMLTPITMLKKFANRIAQNALNFNVRNSIVNGSLVRSTSRGSKNHASQEASGRTQFKEMLSRLKT